MRSAVTALAVLIGLGAASPRAAVQTPASAAAAATVVSDYRFGAGTGLLVFHVHRDRTADFEAVMQRVAEGLRGTSDPTRRDQAAGWRVFRARDTSDAAIYVVLVDPVVRDADYDPVKMLTELAPAEASALYERLRNAVARVERLDLDRLP
jgi:hypothetical protein